MPNESQIDRIEQMYDDMARLGGKSERTAIFTNVVVIDANPAGLANRIIIQDPRDGDYVPALQVPGVQYANNDLVNVLFVEGTEPLAFQQGSGSSGSNVKVFEIWESDFGAVAWQTGATGNLANVDGETLTLNDSTPTNRILLNPATPLTAGTIRLSDETGQFRAIISSGTAAAASSVAVYDASGTLRFFVNSAGQLTGSDEATFQRINWAMGSASTETTQTMRDETGLTRIQMASGLNAGDTDITLDDGGGADKLELSSSDSYRISFTDGGTDVDINMYRVAVTGTPLMFWDESEDAFSQNKGLQITAGDLVVGSPSGSAKVRASATTGAAGVEIFRMESSETGFFSIADGASAGFLPILVMRSNGVNGWGGDIIGYVPAANDVLIAGAAAVVIEGRQGTGFPGGATLANANLFELQNFGSSILTVTASGDLGVGVNAPLAKAHIDQASTTAAIPVLYLHQRDVDVPLIEFNTTIGVGNAIEAVGAKTLTTTHFGMIKIPGGLVRYFPIGTIA